MHALAGVDLNLVLALHALLEESHVSAAAARIGLSQPAMSHALARLRAHFDDPLLVRSGRAMVPTARAVALRPGVQAAVAELERALVVAPFAPEAQQATVRLTTDDAIGVTWLPRLIGRIRRVAPGLELDVSPRGEPGRKALVRSGRSDLAIGEFSGAGMDLHRRHLYDDAWVCVVRAGHPALAGPIDPERWAALPHLIVSPTGGRRGVVDDRLAAAGLARKVGVAVPHFSTALAVVAASDLTLTVASRVVGAFPGLGLAVFPPPVPLPPIPVSMTWHARTDRDPLHQWLRAQVVECSPIPTGA